MIPKEKEIKKIFEPDKPEKWLSLDVDIMIADMLCICPPKPPHDT